MGYRRFVDREGRTWEVRATTRSEWEFDPVGGKPELPRMVKAPGYERDPFELSIEELQRLLDSSPPARPRTKPSPFLD